MRIQIEQRAVLSLLDRLNKEAPFAASVALNRTAEEVQAAVRKTLPGAFTLRRADFIRNTIKIETRDRATKSKLSVKVGVDETRNVLAKFEGGGVKEPAGKFLAIPQGGVRRNKNDIVPKSQGVKRLLESGKAFIRDGKVFQTIGRGRNKRLILAYLFRRSVPIPKSLNFEETARATIDTRFADNMAGALDSLLRGTFQQGKRS